VPETSQCVEAVGQVGATVVSGPLNGGAFKAGRVSTIAASHAVHDTYTGFLPALLPTLIAGHSLSRTQAGLLTVLLRVPSLSQPLIGHLADRFDLRYLVVLTPMVTAGLMSLVGVAPSYLALIVLLALVGCSSAVLHAVGPVLAGRASGRRLGQGMGFWMVGGELGRTLGPIVVVTAIRILSVQRMPWLMVGGLIGSALLLSLPRKREKLPSSRDDRTSWREGFQVLRPILVPLLAVVVARSLMVASLSTYLPTFLSEEGANLWFAGVSLSVLEAAGVGGALLGGSLSDRLGRRTVLAISLSAAPLLMLLFLATEGWVRFPILLLLGLTGLSITPVLMALVQETSPENRALANGVYMSLSFTVSSGAALLVGAMGDWFGLRLAFTVSAITPLLGLPFVRLLRGGSLQGASEQ